jgi:DNA-directed RNA polymerase specialized sigma24 family protein
MVIAGRRLVDQRRRERVIQLIRDDDLAREMPDHFSQDALLRAFAELDPQMQAVVVMKLLRGMKFQEISVVTGDSVGALKMRFSRAIQNVRAALEREGINQ